MKFFDEIDPISIDNNSSVAGSLSDNRSPTTTYYVLTPNDYAIIVVCDFFTNKKTGESKWLTHQLEFPRSGINWIVTTLENKFLKLSHEGGLPAD
ncbi:hypothetical protein, partial [Ketobacter sp.]|uniref:hypothetical protein n=1 Tax=Ketobacter sp. TaxID=2083498 RepID=UPI0025C2EB49